MLISQFIIFGKVVNIILIYDFVSSIPGSVWSKNKLEAPGWEIEAGVRVTGRGRVGADGMVCLSQLFRTWVLLGFYTQ